MIPFISKKKLALILGLAALAGVVILLSADVAWAQPAPTAGSIAKSAAGSAAGTVFGKSVDLATTAIFVYALLSILFSVLSAGLGIVGIFLDNVFNWNLMWSPTTFIVVQDGWRIMRDIANGVFILIVLWIAITIIFNLESLGGRRLLVRVIIVALLINFSLLMVSTVFGFANALAKPFHTALGLTLQDPDRGVSGIIIKNSYIQQVADKIAGEGILKDFENSLKKLQAAAPVTEQSRFASLLQSVGAPQEAHAVGPIAGALIYFGVSALATLATSLLSGAIAVGVVAATWQTILNVVIADGFLLITMLALFTAFIILALRLAAMIFLGILAPIAFIGAVIPRYGERFWNEWLRQLLNWAFLAPVFYFLLYISLLFLQQLSDGSPGASKDISFTGNAIKMLNLTLFLVLLWTSIIVARRMGGAIAETALSFGKRAAGFGLGLATGGAARLALPAAGRLATRMAKGINRIPLLRTTLGRGVPAYGLRRVAAAGRQQVIDRRRRFDGMTSEEIQQGLGSGAFRTSVDLAAASQVLQGRGDLAPKSGVKGYGEAQQRRAADVLKALDLDFVPFQRANPLISRPEDFSPKDIEAEKVHVRERQKDQAGNAREIGDQEAAWRLTWRKIIRSQDMEKMDLGILGDDTMTTLKDGREITKGDLMKEMLLELGKNDHLTRLGRVNSTRAQDVQDYLEKTPEGKRIWDLMDQQKKDYFVSNLARELVWRTPAYAQGGGTTAA